MSIDLIVLDRLHSYDHLAYDSYSSNRTAPHYFPRLADVSENMCTALTLLARRSPILSFPIREIRALIRRNQVHGTCPLEEYVHLWLIHEAPVAAMKDRVLGRDPMLSQLGFKSSEITSAVAYFGF